MSPTSLIVNDPRLVTMRRVSLKLVSFHYWSSEEAKTSATMKLFTQLAILVVILQLVSCVDQTWENIKHWYKDMDYDKDAADTNMARLTSFLSRYAEGFCYEEELFRKFFWLIGLTDDDKKYVVRGGLGLFKIEYVWLRLGTEFHRQSKSRSEVPMNTKLFERVMACNSFSFVPREELRLQLAMRRFEDGNVCAEYMNDEDKEKIGAMLDCVKQKLTPDP